MFLLSLLLALMALVLLLPTFSDLVARTRSRHGSRRPAAPLSHDPPRLLFLIPAHDEELLIRSCVRSLSALRYPRDRVMTVVIADNCRDDTARIARSEGATCLERNDLDRPGKPHAIAWALDQLAWEGSDAIVIVDADSEVDPEFGVALARLGPLRDRAVQGYHRVLNPDESALTRLGALLSAASHRFAYPVKQRADLNTPLLGNGMCIGTGVLARHGWRAFTICEDWEMYAALTVAGVRIDGAPEAVVSSQEARTLAQSASQRRRWTAGKLTVLARFVGPLLESRAITAAQKLDAIAELGAPGAALHLGVVVLLVGGTAFVQPPGAPFLAGALVMSLVRQAFYAIMALRVERDPTAALKAFLFLPAYTFWRLAVAIASLRMLGDRPWVRTARHRPAGT